MAYFKYFDSDTDVMLDRMVLIECIDNSPLANHKQKLGWYQLPSSCGI